MSSSNVMQAFGYKIGWLAFRAVTQERVVDLLSLSGAESASWRTAIDGAYGEGGQVAVLPPLPGVGGSWVLVPGRELLQPVPNLVELAKAGGGEVQHFATHRIVEFHAWARADAGQLVRSFAFLGESGETQSWVGQPGPDEIELGLPDTSVLDDAADDAVLEAGIDEESVMHIAGVWSINPQDLEGAPSPGAPLIANLTKQI